MTNNKHEPACKACTHDESRHEQREDGSRGVCSYCGCAGFVARGSKARSPRLVHVRGNGAPMKLERDPARADALTLAAADSIRRVEIDHATGYQPRTRNDYLASLTSRALIRRDGSDRVIASDALFATHERPRRSAP